MKFIKGPNMKDVCFQIYGMYEDAKHYNIRGLWWNIAMGDPFPMGAGSQAAIEVIKIKIEDFKNWKEYNDPRTAQSKSSA